MALVLFQVTCLACGWVDVLPHVEPTVDCSNCGTLQVAVERLDNVDPRIYAQYAEE